MDLHKAEINPTDEFGAYTAGDVKTLQLQMKVGDTATTVTAATFETFVPANDGTTVVLPDAQHSIVESGGNNVGRVNLAVTATLGKRFKRGRKVPFMTKVTIGGNTIAYIGEIDEVRDALV